MMQGPSRTALGVAVHRAVHQQLEGGSIFHDPFARAILGPGAEAAIAERSSPEHLVMRMFMAVRSRFAQDSLAAAVARGVKQVVVLGAGLDTTALRNPGLTVFEVDHPATQEWKREQLARLGIALPAGLRFAPVDFEREKLPDGLAAAGFDAASPAFFIWLGVVPYLTRPSIEATLDFVASVPNSEVVFDYSEPLENYLPEDRERIMALAKRVAALGEPFLSHFDPPELVALLRSKGFDEIEDLGSRQIGARFFNQPDRPQKPSGHVLRARRA
jgi:methyltransferase (TIGR00027 family)